MSFSRAGLGSAAAPRATASASSKGSSSTATTTTSRSSAGSKPRVTATAAGKGKGKGRSISTTTTSRTTTNNSNSSSKGDSDTASRPRTGYTQRPSARLNKNKAANPFAPTKSFKTSFGQAYSTGGIPCHIQHGSVKSSITWDMPIEQCPYDPLLVTCLEGFLETQHPFTFVAPLAFRDLVTADRAAPRVVALLPRLMAPLKAALMSGVPAQREAGLAALVLLSETVGPDLTPVMGPVLAALNRSVFDRVRGAAVMDALQCLEQNGGEGALSAIKAKVPTYTSVFF